jgi:hypothetical protein
MEKPCRSDRIIGTGDYDMAAKAKAKKARPKVKVTARAECKAAWPSCFDKLSMRNYR